MSPPSRPFLVSGKAADGTAMSARVVLIALLIAGCSAGCAGPRRSGTPASPPGTGVPACTAAGTSLSLTAHDLAYSTGCLAVRANTAFSITFTNNDAGVGHNVAIHTGNERYSVPAPWLFMGERVVGPATVTYRVGGLPAGHYVFLCDYHHDQMTGQFLVTGS